MKENIKDLDHVISNFNKQGRCSVYESLPSGYMAMGLDGKILGINSIGRQILGLTEARKESLLMTDFLCKYEKANFSRMLIMAKLKGCVNDFELKINKGGRQVKHIKISASAIYDSDKNVIGIQCLLYDQDKEKCFIEHVKEELDLYTVFFQNLPLGAAIKCDGEFSTANKILLNFLEYPEEYLIKIYLPDLLDGILVKNYADKNLVRPIKIKTRSGQENLAKVTRFKTYMFSETEVEVFLFDLSFSAIKKYPKKNLLTYC